MKAVRGTCSKKFTFENLMELRRLANKKSRRPILHLKKTVDTVTQGLKFSPFNIRFHILRTYSIPEPITILAPVTLGGKIKFCLHRTFYRVVIPFLFFRQNFYKALYSKSKRKYRQARLRASGYYKYDD